LHHEKFNAFTMEIVKDPCKVKKVKKEVQEKKIYKLIDFFGCLKGQISYNESIFDFAK